MDQFMVAHLTVGSRRAESCRYKIRFDNLLWHADAEQTQYDMITRDG